MIFTKNGVARTISGNTLFAILFVSVLLVASTAAATYALLSAQGKLSSSGRIVVVGVKVTAVGSNADLQSLEWGDLAAGSTTSRQISVINNGTIATALSMSVDDWVPLIAQQYLTITWNYASGTYFNQALHRPSP